MKKRMVALFMATCMCAGALTGCGNDAQTTTATTATTGDSTSNSVSDEAPAEEGGLVWNEELQIYELEEEVLNGSAPLKLWVDNEQLAEAVKQGFEAT